MNDPKVDILFNFYGYYRGVMAGSVYDSNGLAPSLTCNGGNREPMIFEICDVHD